MQSISIDGSAKVWWAYLKAAMGQDQCTAQQIFRRARRWASRNGIPFEEDSFARFCQTRPGLVPEIAAHVKHYVGWRLSLEVTAAAFASVSPEAVPHSFTEHPHAISRKSTIVCASTFAASSRRQQRESFVRP